ncbi:L-2-hydroxyglutarate oxidase [Seonamhaeicola maritimus]|uniref:L-2-hydroxyglutarate oxidase n=1 Tax=Seonamhaeicola maritimus TaxID=2591822 RepID=A0A5C7GGF8_9FLAO|nr:L-2-hydroxyglutarate oxidase [Seonamhaeicola maritimus]TXG36830.1 L-2-hydroxyglutarate oxidase [Seonamhaeicola maritimus]
MNTQKTYDITIVGGGIVGAATAYKLQISFPSLKILLIEKENSLAAHQTGNNSGVIHSGLYYKPGSAKAKNCVVGRKELVDFAKKHKVKHDVCGKVVAAVDKCELPFLDKIFNNGLANNTEGIEKIDAHQLKDIEPHVESIGGIWVPCTGIIDFKGATETFADIVVSKQPNSKIVLGEKVIDYSHGMDTTEVVTSKNRYTTKHMIFCGGLQADRLAKKDNVRLKERVVGFRGDYYNLTDAAKNKVRNLIYPVPNPAFPFLGVHFTRMVNGDVECGPNAVITFKREGYGKTDFSLKDTVDALTYSGTWNLLKNHTGFAINEYRRAFSKRKFLTTLQRLIPSLTMGDIEPGRAGVRAMLLKEDGSMQDDFRIEYKDKSIHVLNAPSPAATACLAIGDSICEMATKHFNLG